MVNVASIFSTLGNPNSLVPLAIKDITSSAGVVTGSFITGKEEGHDRFIDEAGTEVIWLGGLFCPDFLLFWQTAPLRHRNG